MCSIAEIEQTEDNTKTSKRRSRRAKDKTKSSGEEGGCMKCPEKAVVLVRNGDPLCKTCFLDYIVHKFRATIGKARVIRQGERVLLAVSGGASSCAMLDLVMRGLNKDAVKKLRFQPGVLHIDEGELLGRTVEERKITKDSIENLASQAGFPFHCVMLENLFIGNTESACLSDDVKDLEISDQASTQSSRIIELFNKVNTMTAKEDLLLHCYRWQLQKTAKEHGYDRIMVGDCSTSLAIRILSDVAQGRGSQLPFNISFEDDRTEISIVRPLREFTKKEIEFYNCFNQVSSFSVPSFSTKASTHASVNRLTQEFLLGLQAGFPSTISTVVRTGDKLSSNVGNTCNEACSLCLAPMESGSNLAQDDTPRSCDGQSGKSGSSTQQGGSGHHGNSSGGCHGDANGCHGSGGCHGTGGEGTSGGGDGGCVSGACDGGHGSDGNDSGSATGGSGGGIGDSESTIVGSCFDTGGNDNAPTTSGSSVGGCCTNQDVDGCSGGGKNKCCSNEKTSYIKIDIGESLTANEDNANGQSFEQSSNDILNTLCYGCQLTYHDLKGGESLLPEFVIDNAANSFQRTKMKEKIKDFLLDE